MALDYRSGTTPAYEQRNTEITLGIVKPHAYKHRIEIESMIAGSGLLIPVRKYPFLIPRSLAVLHYEEHFGKPFYNALIEMMTSGPSEIMIVEGPNAISRLSVLTGATDPRNAEPGTIRNKFGDKDGRIMYNAFHRTFAENPDAAKRAVKREINLYFTREELPEHVTRLLDEL